MCIHFTPTRNNAWVKQRLGVDLPTGNFPEETYPGYAAPLVLKSHQTGRVACGLAKFGLIPGWAKDEKKAQRWRIALASQEPFGIASIWDTWTNPATGELVTSFSMLTVNADHHPVMNQFHKPGDEKRTPVILSPDQYEAWLSADTPNAAAMMNWHHMPALQSHENSQKHV